MSATAALDELLNNKSPRSQKACSVCGATRTVQVVVRIGRVDDSGVAIKGQSVTLAAQFCDDHGLEAFTASKKAIGR